MPIPTLPLWASNANYSAGPDGPSNPDGAQPTKVDPGVGSYPDGFTPGTGAVASMMNWVLFNVYAALTYVFTYAYDAATQEHTYETPKTRVLYLDPSAGNGYNPAFVYNIPATYPSWTVGLGSNWWGGIASWYDDVVWNIPIRLPGGCKLTLISVRAAPGGCINNSLRAGGLRCRVELWDIHYSTGISTGGAAAYNVTTIMSADITDTAGATGSITYLNLATLPGGGYVCGAGHLMALAVIAGNDGGAHAVDRLDLFAVQFVDYGPRNA